VILPTTAITEMNVQKEKFNIKIYPNPTRNRVNIQLTGLVNAKRINLKIYDVTGRLVRQWDNRTMRPSDKVTWSGDDDLGWRLPSGVYFIQLVTDEFKKVEKVILLR
jgi:flagellar hook assembly protein FlgD